jgi:hypothetical protein
MKTMMTLAGAALLATSVAGAAFAQGSNMNATQPNSTGTGTYTPGTTSTGQAVDKKQSGTTTGMAKSKESKSVNSKPMSNGMMKKDSTGKQ